MGLMYRQELPSNRGMLFSFEELQKIGFWMKDVPMPLDMVFLLNGAVIEIVSAAPPCLAEPCPSYGPRNQLVNQVIELRSGRAAQLGLCRGDMVHIQPLRF